MDLLPPVSPTPPVARSAPAGRQSEAETPEKSGFSDMVADAQAAAEKPDDASDQTPKAVGLTEPLPDLDVLVITEDGKSLPEAESSKPVSDTLDLVMALRNALQQGQDGGDASTPSVTAETAPPAEEKTTPVAEKKEDEASEDQVSCEASDAVVLPVTIAVVAQEPVPRKPELTKEAASAQGARSADLLASKQETTVSLPASDSREETPVVTDTTDSRFSNFLSASTSSVPARQADVITTPPKVETTVNHPVTDKGWPAALGEHMVFLANQEVSTARLHVTPPDMGPIAVEIRHDGNRIDVNFIASHGGTREALQQAMPELKDAFSSQGMQLRADIHDGGQGQQAPTREEWLLAVAARSGVVADKQDQLSALEQQARSLKSDSLLDYYV